MHHLLALWFGWVHDWGYLGIIILMAMESSIFPVPSEVVIPPAAYWAAQGKLNFWGVVAAGTFGSWLGAAITYWVALKLGRILFLKWGRYFLIDETKLLRSEIWLQRYETGGIFFARLLPVVRHLISIPAGIVRMRFSTFSLMTLIGSAIWCYILAHLGVAAYKAQPDLIENPEALVGFVKHHSLVIVGIVVVLCALYLAVMRMTSKKSAVTA